MEVLKTVKVTKLNNSVQMMQYSRALLIHINNTKTIQIIATVFKEDKINIQNHLLCKLHFHHEVFEKLSEISLFSRNKVMPS